MTDNTTILATLIAEMCVKDEDFAAKLAATLLSEHVKNTEPAKPSAAKPKPAKPSTAKPKAAKPATRKVSTEPKRWYDEFRSEFTTVKILKNTVQVKVARGHAPEWHDKLRAAGFSWSKKGFWWASLDDEKREVVATRNKRNDELTKGMTYEQKREFWRNRKAQSVA